LAPAAAAAQRADAAAETDRVHSRTMRGRDGLGVGAGLAAASPRLSGR
jgi:hypothetical protein